MKSGALGSNAQGIVYTFIAVVFAVSLNEARAGRIDGDSITNAGRAANSAMLLSASNTSPALYNFNYSSAVSPTFSNGGNSHALALHGYSSPHSDHAAHLKSKGGGHRHGHASSTTGGGNPIEGPTNGVAAVPDS